MANYLSEAYKLATNIWENFKDKRVFEELRENLIAEAGISPDDLDFQFESYERTLRAEQGQISNAWNVNANGDLYWTNRVKELQDFSMKLKTKTPEEPKTSVQVLAR